MDAVLLPLFRAQRLQKGEVGLARRAELSQGQAEVALGVVSGGDPCVLIESLNGDTGSSENGADPPAARNLPVREMSQDFSRGPFVGGGTLAELGGGDSFDEAIEFLRGSGLHLDRVVSLGVANHAMSILLSCFGHVEILSPFAHWCVMGS